MIPIKQTKRIKNWEKRKIKDFYLKDNPTDDLGEELDSKMTFERLILKAVKGKYIYDLMGVDDSLIREHMFRKIAYDMNVEFSFVDNLMMPKYTNYSEIFDGWTKEKVNRFYKKLYPEDPLGNYLNKNITFGELILLSAHGKATVSELIGTKDYDILFRILTKIKNEMNVDARFVSALMLS